MSAGELMRETSLEHTSLSATVASRPLPAGAKSAISSQSCCCTTQIRLTAPVRHCNQDERPNPVTNASESPLVRPREDRDGAHRRQDISAALKNGTRQRCHVVSDLGNGQRQSTRLKRPPAPGSIAGWSFCLEPYPPDTRAFGPGFCKTLFVSAL